MGMFAYTIDCVDIATGWTEQKAVWGKGEHGVMAQIKDIEKHLPFPLLSFDSDNGSEFLNYHLLRHFTERKNLFSLPEARLTILNKLYSQEWRPFHNCFCPSVKLVAKQRIASKTLKRYDNPKTPFQRVMESPHIPENVEHNLKEQSLSLNPFLLRKAMEIKLKRIFMLCYKSQL